MAAPIYIQASTGATDSAGTFTFTGVATGTIGDLVVMQIANDGTGTISWGAITGTNIDDLAGSANVWTEVGIFHAGAAIQQRIFLGRRTSATVAPTFVAASNTSGDDVYGRMYEFTNVNAGTLLSDVIENATAGSTTTAGATASGTIADASVQTLDVDRLALNFVAINDDNAVAAFTGETGGDWTEAVAEYADATGTDACIQLQIAYPSIESFMGPTDSTTTNVGGVATQQQAQSFTTNGAVTATRIRVIARTNGSPTDNLVAEIQSDSAGAPSGTVVGTGDIVAAASLTTTPTWTQFDISASLSAATTYWVVVRRDGTLNSSNNYWVAIATTDLYAGGARRQNTSGAWDAPSGDMAFSVETSSGTTIDGGTATNVDAADTWGTVGFALIGTTAAAPPATLLPEQGYVLFNDPGVC